MALAPLAAAADLWARGIDIADADLIESLLAAASESVRDAAGVPISSTTSTLTVLPNRGHWLDVPGPVTAVTSLTLDGTAVTDHRIIGSRIWREYGWLTAGPHALIEVTYTHGLAVVPADIVDLVCSLVAGALTVAVDDAYNANRNLTYENIDDYRRGFQQGADAPTSPMDLPERTRLWLRGRFGSGVSTVGTY